MFPCNGLNGAPFAALWNKGNKMHVEPPVGVRGDFRSGLKNNEACFMLFGKLE